MQLYCVQWKTAFSLDFEARGLFFCFGILSDKACLTTLQAHLGQEQRIKMIAGHAG